MFDQQRLRPACAYAQSDQILYLSLEYSISVKLLAEHHLEFLISKGGYTGWSESTLAKNATVLEISCRGSFYQRFVTFANDVFMMMPKSTMKHRRLTLFFVSLYNIHSVKIEGRTLSNFSNGFLAKFNVINQLKNSGTYKNINSFIYFIHHKSEIVNMHGVTVMSLFLYEIMIYTDSVAVFTHTKQNYSRVV